MHRRVKSDSAGAILKKGDPRNITCYWFALTGFTITIPARLAVDCRLSLRLVEHLSGDGVRCQQVDPVLYCLYHWLSTKRLSCHTQAISLTPRQNSLPTCIAQTDQQTVQCRLLLVVMAQITSDTIPTEQREADFDCLMVGKDMYVDLGASLLNFHSSYKYPSMLALCQTTP